MALLPTIPSFVGYLHHLNAFVSGEEKAAREATLQELATIVERVIHDALSKSGLTDDMIMRCGFALHTFGSYRLGIDGPGADIDVLCIGPQLLERALFLEGLRDELLKESINHDILVSLSFLPNSKPEKALCNERCV